MKRRVLGRTGLPVSPIGFGGYRVASEVEEHRDALTLALDAGINLIDTSANYTDGGSELLIGSTLLQCEAEGMVERDDVVLVTKGGYIQGTNYDMAVSREERSDPLPEVVKAAPGLWHCIHPEFLEDQITRSLERLQVETIDVYLLHNPEYFLEDAARQGMPPDEARLRMDARIARAFRHLEYEVLQGRIRWYGISSNSFPTPADESDHLSLERMESIAAELSSGHHFGVIQFPMNLYEHRAATFANQTRSTMTLLQYARERNLGVLVNRPLNALAGDQLIRLAEPPGYAEIREEQVGEALAAFREAEAGLYHALTEIASSEEMRKALPNLFSMGDFLLREWRTVRSPQQFNELFAQHFHPRFTFIRQIVSDETSAGGEEESYRIRRLFHGFRAAYRAAMEAVASILSNRTRETSNRLHALLASAMEGKHAALPLSRKALFALLATPGISSVLLGMRRNEYVEDALAAVALDPERETSFPWEKWKSILS